MSRLRPSRPFRAAAVLALILALAAARGPASAEDLAAIATKAGNLRLVVEDGARALYLGQDRELFRGTPYLTIHRFFRPKAYDAMLLRDMTGPIHCPVRFSFLTLFKEGEVLVTPPFGHCSDQPELTIKGDRITVKFRSFGSMPEAVWVYDGKNLVKEK